MHVVVCVTQVTDASQMRVDPATDTFLCEGVPAVVNPFDFAALECALILKDHFDATVTLLAMSSEDATPALRQCLAYGADRAVLLRDDRLAGSDAYATSYALSMAVRAISVQQPVDLVLCGQQTIDGGTGQTGPGIARHLGWQQITSCSGIMDVDPQASMLVVERKLDCGKERIRTTLPAVVSVVETATIRQASLSGLIRAERYTPLVWNIEAINADPAQLGADGSPTRVTHLDAPRPRAGGGQVAVADSGLDAAVSSAMQVLAGIL